MKRSTLGWGLAGLLATAIGLTAMKVLALTARADAVCDPVAVRPWAAADFDARVASRPAVRWPTMTSAARPGRTAKEESTPNGARLTVAYEPMPSTVDPIWSLFERLPVGPTMKAALPGGPDVELLYWRQGNGPWLSPVNGSPLAVQPKPRITRKRTGGFTFAVQLKGGNVRVHGCRLFDTSTKVSLSPGSSWGEPSDTHPIIQIHIRTQVHHRANLMLELPLTYGAGSVQVLDLKEGAKVAFGTDFDAEFLARGPGRVQQTFSSDEYVGIGWALDATTGWAAFSCFPFESILKLQARVAGATSWQSMHSPGEVPVVRDVPLSAQAIELRYLPHAVRLQFELPPPATLPEVDDLFAVEMGTLTFEGPWNLGTALTQCLQLEPLGYHELGLDGHSYPMTVKDATPARLLELAVEHATPGTRLDLGAFRFGGKRLPIMVRVRAWVAARARRLGF